MEKIVYSVTHSINQSPSLFDVPGTEAISLWNIFMLFQAVMNCPT